LINPGDLEDLLEARLVDAFSVLGPQSDDTGVRISCFAPAADSVQLIDLNGDSIGNLSRIHDAGVFTQHYKSAVPYRLRVMTGAEIEVRDDPYLFSSLLADDDVWLFSEGRHQHAQRFLGAHLANHGDVAGIQFAVWAPNAQRVAVVGDFNHWDTRTHVMRYHPGCGIWEMFVPGPGVGTCYAFDITSQDAAHTRKSDPYARQLTTPADPAAVVVDASYAWHDSEWLQKRRAQQGTQSPMSIYEVHLGSWRRKAGGEWLSYAELTLQLLNYVQDMGFTHLELMPVTEYPYSGSWGYQPLGLFAATARFGPAAGLKALIDEAHKRGIGVILDWVPAHFPRDAHGLGRFDGTALYEHEDPQKGLHPDWGTLIFNYGRPEVINYLVSNALYWIEEFHIDGLRMDAVASMLYLDYSREPGEWVPNAEGGRENLEAVEFLRQVNSVLLANHPGVLSIAEESTAWPGVTTPVTAGGLGFSHKWNMGWMNDSLAYMENEPIHRQYHHHQMTFSMVYAYSERYILPISHDETVHGKRSLLSKMPGDTWQKFANVRALLGLMWAHPGGKLLFMGDELAQWQEWDHDDQVHWQLLEQPAHQGVQQLVRDLNAIQQRLPALYENDHHPEGFRWIDSDNASESILAFSRHAVLKGAEVVVIANLTPIVRENYRVVVSAAAVYEECLNTDSNCYGGSNVGNLGRVEALIGKEGPFLELTLPPLAVIYLTRSAT
jgi:1,4-alpha-glucan branching enzyme